MKLLPQEWPVPMFRGATVTVEMCNILAQHAFCSHVRVAMQRSKLVLHAVPSQHQGGTQGRGPTQLLCELEGLGGQFSRGREHHSPHPDLHVERAKVMRKEGRLFCAETLVEWVLSLSNIGRRKAAVFPEPVLAMATTSLPSITKGMHWRPIQNLNFSTDVGRGDILFSGWVWGPCNLSA